MTFNPKSSTATIGGIDYQLIAFYYPGKNEPWDNFYQAPFFGNFWQAPLTVDINGISASFHTCEAAFQATKWWNHDSIRKQFEDAKTGNEAFHIKKNLSTPADYSYAGLGRDGAMMKVLESKFQDTELRNGLLATNDAYLLEHNSRKGRDDYWSDDHDGTGYNMLGISLMKLRVSLGGSSNPYSGDIVDMTNNVQSKSLSSFAVNDSKVKVIGSVFSRGGKEGDFGWMIDRPEYASAFFIFNDNTSQFEDHQKDPKSANGCSVGGGNAVIRPYQCKSPAKAGGIPTGPNYKGLTPDVKSMIDAAILTIKNNIKSGGYDTVYYSSNGHGGLGTSIFKVPQDVKTYIVDQINSLG